MGGSGLFSSYLFRIGQTIANVQRQSLFFIAQLTLWLPALGRHGRGYSCMSNSRVIAPLTWPRCSSRCMRNHWRMVLWKLINEMGQLDLFLLFQHASPDEFIFSRLERCGLFFFVGIAWNKGKGYKDILPLEYIGFLHCSCFENSGSTEACFCPGREWRY